MDGKVYVSRPNICGIVESLFNRQHVVVHIVGTLRRLSTGMSTGVYYTAFRCSEWILPLSMEPMFDRYGFDKRNLYNSIVETFVSIVEIFVKKGYVSKILINPSCEEYVETVRRLYGFSVKCKTG